MATPLPSTPPPRGRRRLWPLGLAGLMALAIAAQARVWLSSRGLWEDEVYLAVNLRYVPTLKLGGPLLHRQVAPPGWLVIAQEFGRVFGWGETALRAIAFLGAAASVVAIGLLALRSVGRVAAVVSVAAAGISTWLLYYAGDVKQYSAEAAASAAVLLASGWTVDRQKPTLRRLAVFGVAAVGAAAVSYAGAVMIAGVVAGGASVLLAGRRVRDAVLFTVAGVPGGLLSAWLIERRLRLPVVATQYEFFANGMPARGSGVRGIVTWLPHMWSAFTVDPIGWRASGVLLLAVLAGLVSWLVRGRAIWAGLVAGVLLAAVGAAAIGQYPLATRVALYLLGPTVVAAVAGVDGVVRLARHGVRLMAVGPHTPAAAEPSRWRALSYLVPALLLLPLVAYAAWPAVPSGISEIAHPSYPDPLRDVLADIRPQVRPGDAVFVNYDAITVAGWYGSDLPITAYAILSDAQPCPANVARQVASAKRIWWAYSTNTSGQPPDLAAAIGAQLAQYATPVLSRSWHTEYPAGWELFDVGKGPDPSPHPAPADVPYSCLTLFIPQK